MTSRPVFSLDKTWSISNDKTFILTTDSDCIGYICGVLNSKVIEFTLRQICAWLWTEWIELRKIYMQSIPIPFIIPSNQSIVSQIESLVSNILETKKQDPEKDTTELEREIDKLVYELYELTSEEIAVVEASMKV